MSHFQGHLAVGVLCVIQQSLEQHNPSRCEHLSHVSIHLLPAHAFIVAQLSAQRNKLVCKLTLGPSETETVGIIVRENIPRQHLAHRHGHGRGVDEFARYRQKLTWFFWDANQRGFLAAPLLHRYYPLQKHSQSAKVWSPGKRIPDHLVFGLPALTRCQTTVVVNTL